MKYNLEKAKEIFEKEGYKLTSTEYINCVKKLDYLCPEGHIGSINIHNWNKGHRCSYCGGSKKKDIEFIKAEFQKEGYTLLSTEYKDKNDKLEYICPHNHKWKTSWGKWKQGRRCKLCKDEKNGDWNKFSYEDVKKKIEENGETLLSETYTKSFLPLTIRCSKGHTYTTLFTYWNNGHRCKTCSLEIRNDKLRDNIDNVRHIFEKEGYLLLTPEYKSRVIKMLYVCPKGHTSSITTANFLSGHRCGKCSAFTSKAENEIKEFLREKVEIIENTRAIIYPFELDIVIPEKNYAIEYCGLYWHSEANGKDKNYHLNKLRKCENNNYHLITIFEDEWLHNKELVKKRLLVKLGISNSQKVYARNCLIREIDNKTKKDFLIRNHMQGDDTSSIKLGAYYKDDLVAVMTFRTSFREKENKPYELSRFCSDYDYLVVGIAGKLFKYFVKKYFPEQVITFGDRRWNTGSVYEKLGFKFKYNTPPNYWYVVGDRRYHRFNFRKNNIKYFENYSPDKTEQEITEAEGYHRLYDCGNSKWIWSLNN